MTSKDIHYIQRALEVSKLSTYNRVHVGCIIVYKREVIGVGYNSNKTHPVQKRYNSERFSSDSTPHKLHAEIKAICSCRDMLDVDWKKVSVYIARMKKTGRYGMARPCPACMKCIKDLGISHIVYTMDDGIVEEYI